MLKYLYTSLVFILAACSPATNTEADRIVMPAVPSTPTEDTNNETLSETPDSDTETTVDSADLAEDMTESAEAAMEEMAANAMNLTGRWQLAAVNSETGNTFNLTLDIIDTAGNLAGDFYITADDVEANRPNGVITGNLSGDQLNFRIVFDSTTAAGENEFWEINAELVEGGFSGDYVTIYDDEGTATGTPAIQ